MARPTSTHFAVAVHVLTYLASVSDQARAVSSEELARGEVLLRAGKKKVHRVVRSK